MSMVCSILVWGFESLKSINDLLCSLTLALVTSHSLLDQSNSWGEGCGTPCLQYEHDRRKMSHAFLTISAIMLILFRSDTFVSGVLGLFVFIGLNWFLPDHLVLILPVVCFLGFLGILGGVEIGLCYCYSMVSSYFVLCNFGMPVSSILERKRGLLSYSMG